VVALSTMLPQAGVAGRVLLRMLEECMRSDLEAALLVLAGMNLYLPGAASVSSEVQLEERAKAAWLLEEVKNYLVQAWRMRESQLGRAQVVRGNLAWLPSLDAGERTCKFLQRPDFEEMVGVEDQGNRQDVEEDSSQTKSLCWMDAWIRIPCWIRPVLYLLYPVPTMICWKGFVLVILRVSYVVTFSHIVTFRKTPFRHDDDTISPGICELIRDI
jgi:hypothetical protein